MLRAIAACSLVAAVAWAAPDPSTVARAKAHFEAGEGLYKLGDFQGAARQFAAGYSLVPKVEFLINLGQAYRGIGDLANARRMFERFLEQAPGHPSADGVRAMLLELPTGSPARAPVLPPPEPSPPAGATPPAAATAPPSAIRADDAATVTKPVHRSRAAIAVAAVAALLLVAGGVALAVYLYPRGPTPSGGAIPFYQ